MGTAELVDLNKEFHLGNGFTLETCERLAKLLTDEYRVIVKYDMAQDMPLYSDNKLNVVISTSRETHDAPNEFHREDVLIIFQHYFMLDSWGHPMHNPLVFPLPLGPFNDDKEQIIKPLSERKYDFSFVGQIPDTGTRDCFKRNLDKLIENTDDKFKFFVRYTDGFARGLDAKEYLSILGDSRISLCPQGANSLETFRFFESIMMGAIPLVEILPKLWYYESSPHFKGPWRDLDRTLSRSLNFLQSPNCRQLLYQVGDYCNKVLMPQNLAKYLQTKIEHRRKHVNTHRESLGQMRKNLNELDSYKL